MSPYRSAHPLLAALSNLVAPLMAALQRVGEIPPIGWAWGLIIALANALISDVFTGIFLLTVATCVFDHSWGVRVVRETRPKEYDPKRRAAGRDQKIITLLLLLLLRGAEAWAVRNHLLDVGAVLSWVGAEQLAAAAAASGGVISALICAALWVDELQSLHEHRVRLGGRPIRPLLLLFGGADLVQRALQGRLRAAENATPKPPPEGGS